MSDLSQCLRIIRIRRENPRSAAATQPTMTAGRAAGIAAGRGFTRHVHGLLHHLAHPDLDRSLDRVRDHHRVVFTLRDLAGLADGDLLIPGFGLRHAHRIWHLAAALLERALGDLVCAVAILAVILTDLLRASAASGSQSGKP